jgi:hypothetical protein
VIEKITMEDILSDHSNGNICYGRVSQIDENDGNNESGVKANFSYATRKRQVLHRAVKMFYA